MIAALQPDPTERLWSGVVLLRTQEPTMSLATAQALAFSLACTLMTSIVLFRTEVGGYGVLPIAEYDGAPETVVHTYDPYL